MINCFVTYSFADKRERDSFYNEITGAGVGSLSRAEKGCVRYSYYFPADDDTKLFLWEQWESEDALSRHAQMPHYIKLRSIKEGYSVETAIEKKLTEDIL